MPLRDQMNPWEAAQAYLRKVVDDHSYKNWFSQTQYLSMTNGHLVIGVPSRFFAKWLRDHYMDAIHNSMSKVQPDFTGITFKPMAAEAPPANGGAKHSQERGRAAPSSAGGPAAAKKAARVNQRYSGFNSRYTFEHFVIGSSNRFAHAAARAVADSPGHAYNPLFVSGATGLGKTHLMQAVGQELMRRDPNMKVVFISSEVFTNQLIDSIAKKATNRFREKYRKVDVLLIDDIHFLAGKEATQEEFFHTFNTLYDGRKQIVLSSDRSPKELKDMEERLVSRFEWGLVTDITPPDQETREAILQNKAKEQGVSVPADVIRYIATYVTTNIRELEGALVTLLAYSRLQEQEVNLPMAQEILRDLIGSEKIKPVSIEGVLRVVADEFDVRIADLRGRSRQRHVSFPRQLSMFLCKELIPRLSLKDVGEALGGKDHSTVLYSCEKIAKDLDNKQEVRQTVDRLRKRLRSA